MEVTSTQVCQDVLALLNRFKQEMIRFAEQKHMTTMQISVLYMVAQHGELAMGKVAGVLHCDPSNVTGIIDRLVTQNLVNRTEAPQDRRAKNISLTPAGQAIVDELIQNMPGQLGCDRLSNAERTVLHSAIQKIVA